VLGDKARLGEMIACQMSEADGGGPSHMRFGLLRDVRKPRAAICWKALIYLIIVSGAALNAAPVKAQQLQEVIVTPRKRQESILNVPVVETAISQATLQRFQIQDLKDVATLVPGLALGDNLLSFGVQASLRGVGTNAFDIGVDQSVSLNIDGVQLTQALAFASGLFDVGQIEVLKGPQALFYGKSSPGGVISLRTADPTDRFEIIARAGYEFEAQEKRGDIIVSGPVADSLKVRLAGTYLSQEGFFDNNATALTNTGARDPAARRLMGAHEYQIRGTLLWSPTGQFDARLKVNQVHERILYNGAAQYARCPDGLGAPFGIDFIGGNNSCTLGRTFTIVSYDPVVFQLVPNDGVPYMDTTQTYGSLEMNYRPRRDITVTSVTGYYLMHEASLVNTTATTHAAPAIALSNSYKRHDLTEEIRVNSDFAGPLNFTAGAFIERGGFGNLTTIPGNPLYGLPALIAKGSNDIEIKSASIFGQVRWRIIPEVEIAAGARWSDETRSKTARTLTSGVPIPVSIPVSKIKSDTTSPEVTITYKPAEDWTVFGSARRGFKSGSFDAGAPTAPDVDTSFGDEKVEGYEIGAKSVLLGHRLAVNLAFYDYRYSGLQVGAIVEVAGVPMTRTVNAASSLVYGVDFDAAYRPEFVDGLELSLAAEWNNARFKTLNNAPCFGGQTIAAGCNLALDSRTGLFTAQDLSGRPLPRAPKWQVNFGFDYERDIGHGLTLVVSSNNHYSSSYNTVLLDPYFEKGFIKTDASIAIQGPRDGWEVALIGKNLNNAITTGLCNNYNAQGGASLGGQVTGGTGRGPAGVDEIACFMDRGREIWLRLTLRPTN
jgi:iron complex outermembrane receptor protein